MRPKLTKKADISCYNSLLAVLRGSNKGPTYRLAKSEFSKANKIVNLGEEINLAGKS